MSVPDKGFFVCVLEFECQIVTAGLDHRRYDNVGEGTVTNERFATVLNIRDGRARRANKMLWVDVNQPFIAGVVEKVRRSEYSGVFWGIRIVVRSPVGSVSRGKV